MPGIQGQERHNAPTLDVLTNELDMTKSSISTNSPHPLDVVLGSRIRSRRRELQLSQMRLAQQVGVTFQQIQKYERGANRVNFSRLAEIAEALDCTIAHMVDGVETRKASPVFMKCALHLNEPDAADLLDAYCAIRSLTHRRAVLDLVRQLTDTQSIQKPK